MSSESIREVLGESGIRELNLPGPTGLLGGSGGGGGGLA